MSCGGVSVAGRITSPGAEKAIPLKSGISPGRVRGTGICKVSLTRFFTPSTSKSERIASSHLRDSEVQIPAAQCHRNLIQPRGSSRCELENPTWNRMALDSDLESYLLDRKFV